MPNIDVFYGIRNVAPCQMATLRISDTDGQSEQPYDEDLEAAMKELDEFLGKNNG